MDYGARWYSPASGRFTQPDSIVPNLYSPQSLNRYSYVYNNPIAFADPSGHLPVSQSLTNEKCLDGVICLEEKTLQSHVPIEDAQTYVLVYALKKQADVREEGSELTSLEAMAQIVDKAAEIYGKDEWSPEMLRTLTYVFNGISYSGPGSLTAAFVNNDLLNNPAATHNLTSSGFHQDFQDGSNQVFHFWAYLASTANPYYSYYPESNGGLAHLVANTLGYFEAKFGNIAHEIGPLREGPGSWNDYLLSNAAIEIGGEIASGQIKPGQLGDVLRDRLGVNGAGTNGELENLENLGNLFGP